MESVADEKQIEALLERRVAEVIVKEHLRAALLAGKKLRVKLGFDVTSPDLHLGHAITLRKLREFQNLGHQIVFIIGDYTARIGDPSGRSKTRPMLSEDEIRSNAKTYFDQVGKILDISKTEVHYNSEWFAKKDFAFALELQSKFTSQRILERDDFSKRMKAGTEVYAHETLYPMMQAYDSVEIKSDVEVGGTDQKFNMLAGRDLQRHMGLPEQDVITLPLLRGLDGVQKMSKSLNNYIGITEEPDAMFGKVMSIPDALIDEYYTLCVDTPRASADPRLAKLELGVLIVDLYHETGEGAKARAEFERVFSRKEPPTEVKSERLKVEKIGIVDLLIQTKLAKSKGEARRLIEQGGVKIDDVKQTDPDAVIDLSPSRLVQVGPRKFVRVER